MRRLLRKLFGKRYAQGGTLGPPANLGQPLKLTNAEGYVKIGRKMYYWQEVE